MKEATWLTYSFDVKLEGKNACRLTDKMLMNHGNTVCLAGILQAPLIIQATALGVLAEIQEICNIMSVKLVEEDNGVYQGHFGR